MLDFMLLNSGRTATQFISVVGSGHNVDKFVTFFLSRQNEAYITRFNLKYLTPYIRSFVHGDPTSCKHYNEVLREYTLFKSYLAFQEYSLDPSIFKTHGIYAGLLNSSSQSNTQLIVFTSDGDGQKVQITLV